MSQYTYPGVYVEEIPSGVHTIAGVSTAVAAFIDFFREGPMDKAVKIYGMGDFNRIFGGLDTRSEASYAISQFFLNGGGEAWVVRVAAGYDSDDDDVIDNFPAKAAFTIENENGNPILAIHALYEGVWGNTLRIEVDHNTSDPGSRFNLFVTRYAGEAHDARPVKNEAYLNLSLAADDPRYIVAVITEKSELIEITHTPDEENPDSLPVMNGTVSADLHTFNAFDALSEKEFSITINAVTKTATMPQWAAAAVTDLKGLRRQLERAIRAADTTDAAFAEAKVELVEIREAGVVTLAYFRFTAGKNAKNFDPAETVAFDDTDYTIVVDLKLMGGVQTAQQYEAGTPGDDGVAPGPAEIIGQNGVEPYTGMYALDYVDIFNILSIPRAANLINTEMDTVIGNAITYCEKKRAFLLIDIPATTNTIVDMQDWMDAKANYRHKNSAVYFPRLLLPDPLNEFRLRSVGAGGTVAGLYSKTDSTRGVWKAPAGTEVVVRGISSLDAEITDAQNGTLNPLAINCFRIFPIYGMICWGARTLDGSDQAGSEWKYIPVRRFALFLEESLFRGTKWVVFEPNDEPLWANIRMNIRAFMMSLFRQGAFQGGTPQEAFYVKCDGETTTQNDRNSGVVNIEVGFAPLKPAEFVVIKFQQIVGEL